MSALYDEWLPAEIRHPERPESMNFAFREPVDRFSLQVCRSPEEREKLFERLKHKAAASLARHIATHCKWFDIKHTISPDLTLQLELTINDRGAYENWLQHERHEGHREGWKRAEAVMTASLPYGMADSAEEFYE